jgi:hypothetical protein
VDFLGICSWRLLLTCLLILQKLPSVIGPLIYCQKHILHYNCHSHPHIWGCLGQKLLLVTSCTFFCVWFFSIIRSGWEERLVLWSFHTDPVAQSEIEYAWSDWAIILQWVWYLILSSHVVHSGPRLLFLVLLPFYSR